MSKNINFYSPQTGRRIKEDNSIVNTADMIEAIYNKIVNGQVDMQLSGSSLTEANAMWVKQTSRNVEEITLFNAVAITDTSFKVSGVKDVSKYKSFSIYIVNTHDQEIRLTCQVASSSLTAGALKFWDGTNVSSIPEIKLPSGTSRVYLSAEDFKLKSIPQKFQLVAAATVAPTAGSISAVLMGVLN